MTTHSNKTPFEPAKLGCPCRCSCLPPRWSLHKQVQKFTSSLSLLCVFILTRAQTDFFTCSFLMPVVFPWSLTSSWLTQWFVCPPPFVSDWFSVDFLFVSSPSLPAGHSEKSVAKCRSSPLLPPPPSSLVGPPLAGASFLFLNSFTYFFDCLLLNCMIASEQSNVLVLKFLIPLIKFDYILFTCSTLVFTPRYTKCTSVSGKDAQGSSVPAMQNCISFRWPERMT